MLKAYVNEARDDWDDHLPYVMMAYRASVHDSTNVTPNLMFLGTENILPIDLVVGPPPQDSFPECPVQDVEWLRRTIVLAHETARKHLSKSTLRQKRNYDVRVKPMRYTPGEFVWRWYPPSANRKLGRGWVGPYRVVECPTNLNCVLERESEGRLIRVHVDHLKPYYGDPPPGWSEPESSEPESSEPEGDGDDDPDSDHDSTVVPEDAAPDHQLHRSISTDNADSISGEGRGVTQNNGQRRSGRRRRPPKRLDL